MLGKMISTPIHLLKLWPLLFLLCDSTPDLKIPKGWSEEEAEKDDLQNLLQPPEFTEQPEEELVVLPNDEIILKCKAIGNPEPMYRWTRNGSEFDPGTMQRNDSGTLVITTTNGNVASKFQGVYRCYANNSLGTAMSTKSRIIAENAPQWPKEKLAPIVVEEQAFEVLPCNPPTSAIPSKIYWFNSRIVHIKQDERVTMGQDGNLYFANVQISDSRVDYICHAHFLGPRIIIQKEPIELKVYPTNAVLSKAPHIMMPKGRTSSYVALLGKTLVLECIAAGFPTPSIEWVYLGGPWPSHQVVYDNFNRTLHILNVTEDFDGEYKCTARNNRGESSHAYFVTVEAAPHWIKKPASLIIDPGKNVRLECEVYGNPKPEVTWRINGIKLNELQPHPKRTLLAGALILNQVQPSDTAVVQCEAINKHGSLLANAYVHVVRLPAQILTPDGLQYSVVVNQTASLDCKTFGAPMPDVKWFIDENLVLKYERYFAFTNGTLQLEKVQLEDAGDFKCFAENDQNNVSITAQLIVKEATQIEVGPENMKALKGSNVTFHCKVRFDMSIPDRHIKWFLNEQDFQKPEDVNKYVFNDTSLTITNLDYTDQGKYNCLAQTRLDSVEKSAKLLVVGEPDPVSNLELAEQQERHVKLTWTPGDDHNSPIEKYIVSFEETNFEPGRWRQLITVPGNQPWARVHLSPFGAYHLRVQAVNEHGSSDPISTSDTYTTSEAAPELNPSGVKGEGNDTQNMIITWKPLPPLDWNARELQYIVQWRLRNQAQAPWNEERVSGPPVLVTDTPVFTPYDIKVQAINKLGKGPEPVTFIGYSGEGEPEAVPENLMATGINSTTVRLGWHLPDKRRVWGHIRGFKIYYTRLASEAERSRRQIHPKSHLHREQRELLIEGDVTSVVVGGLRPWSKYQFAVAVRNGRSEGPLSETLEFTTPEGVPGPPDSFTVKHLSNSELELEWKRPKNPNGKLQKYELKYEQVNQTELKTIDIPVTNFTVKLINLVPDAFYKFYLYAVTKVGPGEPSVLVESTTPDLTILGRMEYKLDVVGKDFINISWNQPSIQRNVEFAVHILSKTGEKSSRYIGKANSNQNFYRIVDLQPGSEYVVQFVKENNTGRNETFWYTEVITMGITTATSNSFVTESWFIGFVSAIVLLILVLVLLCFIKRSKGGKYSVKDKEDTQVDSEARPMKDETFGEYSDNEEKPFSSSQPSLNGDIKAMGSDDSLADYGGSVDVQFNEDGSFIGQYSGHKGKDGGGNDSSGATSPTNVVAALE